VLGWELDVHLDHAAVGRGHLQRDGHQADAATNSGTSGAKDITVDKTAPVVTLTKVNTNTVSFPSP